MSAATETSSDAAAHPLASTVLSNRCVVCVGPGGVGKTSTAAALGMYAAAAGKRTVVLTIDPAKRLANALGLSEIGSVERPVSAAAFEQAGLPPPKGQLSAMMLDIKQAWDEVIRRYHPDEEKREKLLNNRLYQAMSTALAGSQEYMAMEKLHALSTRSEDPLDVIILDTPPANHALDFLEAPSRIVNALDNDATRWLVEPYQNQGRLSRRLFDAGSTFFIRTISKFIGTEMLEDLAELLVGFQGMFEGFQARAATVSGLLSAEDTVFVVVTAPSAVGVADAEAFVSRLEAREHRVGAVILNRT
ncbi:MAG: ArsA-related P-loop ATPase, partial [Myxococcota bacterium]